MKFRDMCVFLNYAKDREMNIKTTIKYFLTPQRLLFITKNKKFIQFTAGGNTILVQPSQNNTDIPQKKKTPRN